MREAPKHIIFNSYLSSYPKAKHKTHCPISHYCCCCSASLSCLTLCNPMDCSMLSLSVLHHFPELPKFVFTALVMPFNFLILCCPLPLLASIFPGIRYFSSESAVRIRWLKYWTFSFNICPSNDYSGLISFRIDWFDLLTTQGTFRSLLHNHSLKGSILWHSSFFTVWLSQPHVTTRKVIALSGPLSGK